MDLAYAALVPAALLLWYVYTRDANPEPRGMIVKTFLLGAVICIPVIPAAMLLEGAVGKQTDVWLKASAGAFLGAAVPEECFKFLVLWWASRKAAFDEPMDGIVYGATASLGFAALENVLYVGHGGVGVAVMRALTAVPGHAFFGIIMGAYVGRAKFSQAKSGYLVGLGSAILLHGLYDMFLMTATAWVFMALPVLIVEGLWSRSLIKTARAGQAIPTSLITAPADPLAPAPALPALPGYAPRISAVRSQPVRHLSAWSVVKVILGSSGMSVCGLVLLGVVAAVLDKPGDENSLWGGACIGVTALGVAVASLFLFLSGLKSPFEPAPP